MDQSILYVDIENLQDTAKQLITTAISSWPAEFPEPAAINLYVKADLTDLWRTWAVHNIPNMEVNVKGVQHYTYTGSKNSADLALALDALADLLKGRTKHIAVLSDDSDFASLFAAVKQEFGDTESPETLFKWFMTNRTGTRSQVLIDFFPAEYIYVVGSYVPAEVPPERISIKKEVPVPVPVAVPMTVATTVPVAEKEPFYTPVSDLERIALTIIRNIAVGPFKSADCKKFILRDFPDHPMAKADSTKFGTLFSKDIWPVLQEKGVLTGNPNRKPRRYEMTEEAKKRVEG